MQGMATISYSCQTTFESKKLENCSSCYFSSDEMEDYIPKVLMATSHLDQTESSEMNIDSIVEEPS